MSNAKSLPSSMRYVAAREPGPPDVLAIAEGPVPMPKEGEVLIEVIHAGVNRPDCAQRAGTYPPPADASPIIGLEVAGTVVACGEGVASLRVGDAVCALTPGGGYAEYCTTPAGFCLPIPAGLTMLEAASLPENYFTVWNNLVDRGRLRQGDQALIHGGSSGIGLAAIQLAKQFGATVFTTAGSDDKVAYCKSLGADHPINYRTQDLTDAVLALSGGRGVDVVCENISDPTTFPAAFRSLATMGRLVTSGAHGGGTVPVDMKRLYQRRQRIIGAAGYDPGDVRTAMELAGRGELKAAVEKVMRLDELTEAFRLIHEREVTGKIVIDPQR